MMEVAVKSSDEHPWWKELVDDLSENYDNYSFYEDNSYEEGDVCDLTMGMDFEAMFIPVLYSVVFIVGNLGNGLLIAVLIRTRKTWNVTDTFILHLALADVLLLMTLPLWVTQSASMVGWSFGTPLCKITGAIFTISLYCGIFLLACISVDRYLFIVHSTKMYTRRKPWVVQASCLVVWFFSLILSIPDWYFLEAVEDVRRSRTECVHNYFKLSPEYFYFLRMAARWLYHSMGFLLPSFVLIFCYSSIMWQLGCVCLQKQRAFKVIIAVVAVFFLCWTPLNVTLIVDTIHQNSSGRTACVTITSLHKARLVTESLGYLHCSLSPILYAFVGVKFQHHLLNILRSMGCKLKTSVKSESYAWRGSIWSESADTSNSVAI
ncbi:C-X-C chemokine receptor type 3-like [Girardinichthys multiradiatus]|uniref:C-X-C chemokine receptor type 3-like n=1 Tax=Girardinichthys multiradiatus TaxID=208333 RepID=UPI001FAC8EEC|nr:C-X-C chemokine receptor type 3-like [Girardinichthys multiradiatus]XP_047212563.1 C-X-C chemokine receptor type 3-like [Girardinichthys multiradiatus]